MKKIARISTAAFLAGATTLAVSLPMPAWSKSGVQPPRASELPIRSEEDQSSQ